MTPMFFTIMNMSATILTHGKRILQYSLTSRDQPQHKLAIAVDQDAVDLDTHGTSLEKAYISHLREGRVISEDLVEKRKLLAVNCAMRVAEDALDRSVNSKPLDRRAVKIPCPNPGCDRSLQCSWICESCHSTIEYGVVDSLLYCGCGASSCDKWEFQCNDPNHGSDWNQYESEELLQKLKALEPFKDLNILLLGETGVGKSTWINAFTNYLTYDFIDDALDAENIKCVIPCSFQTQTVIDVKSIETEIRIGSSQSEKDGSGGQSATQSTEVYTVDIGQTRVRLIDTPGIGDTRGVDQDNSNMNDILTVLHTYNNLHGKPMAFISEKISASSDVNNVAIKELHDFELTRQELQERLFIHVETLRSEKVDKPRTVCTHDECVEICTDFEGKTDTATTIFKTVCHPGCSLNSVDRNKKGHPELQRCWAMAADGMCHQCGHCWMDHMHIYYTYVPTTYQHRDAAIDRDLTENAGIIQLKEEAIRMKREAIQEFSLEYRQIEEAAIQFGFFLKRHAIAPYNDAIVEYLDMLIDQERQKIVEVLEKAMKQGDESKLLDNKGVAQLVDSLYALPHFGNDLRNIVKIQESAAELSYRERSYNVSGGVGFHRRRRANRAQKEEAGNADRFLGSLIEEANLGGA
ncbi:aaa atpase domain protein [Fusarium subglutinans]|uniref:Aaa atpase domain protein n=1 Tax=Gibberella subglutinans TaxID=42677 RepID=A0A8H5V5G5_GIBSU|nr:aaa atpase domain protein [Fusarium subglutinans]KAF5611717.1 aaa atpase domain protein [Fusarium subglutinans]